MPGVLLIGIKDSLVWLYRGSYNDADSVVRLIETIARPSKTKKHQE